MPSMPRSRRLLSLLLCAALGAPAFAAPPDWAGGGKGQDKHERKANKGDGRGGPSAGKGSRPSRQPLQGAYFDDRNRDALRAYYSKRCPPGLAKKNNGCMPPGQAKKWNVGEPVPVGVTWTPVPRDVIVLLPAVPVGHQYIQIAGDILLIAAGSRMVVDGVSGLMGR